MPRRVAITLELGELMDLLDLPGTLTHVQADDLRNRLLLVIEHPDLPDDPHDAEPPIVAREYLHDLDEQPGPTPLDEVPQPLRDAAAAFMDAVTDSGLLGGGITVELDPTTDHVTLDLVIRPRPDTTPIDLTIVPPGTIR